MNIQNDENMDLIRKTIIEMMERMSEKVRPRLEFQIMHWSVKLKSGKYGERKNPEEHLGHILDLYKKSLLEDGKWKTQKVNRLIRSAMKREAKDNQEPETNRSLKEEETGNSKEKQEKDGKEDSQRNEAQGDSTDVTEGENEPEKEMKN
jgi:hypothetical protein